MKLFVGSLLFLAMSGWSPESSAETGVVVDRATGKPLAGVQVVVMWTGVIRTAVQPHSSCYRAEVAVTDANGRFEAPGFSGDWNPLLMDRRRVVGAMLPGYVQAPRTDFESLDVSMIAGGEFFQLPGAPFGCPIDEKKTLPYLKVLAAEMQRLAKTSEEQKRAMSMLFAAEEAEFGFAEASRRAERRKAAVK
jgi:hypothetical protein